MRRALQRHRPAAPDIGGLNLVFRKAERGEHVEGEVVQLLVGEAQRVAAEILAQREFVEGEFDVEGLGQALLDGVDVVLLEAFLLKSRVADRVGAGQRPVADGIGDDVGSIWPSS